MDILKEAAARLPEPDMDAEEYMSRTRTFVVPMLYVVEANDQQEADDKANQLKPGLQDRASKHLLLLDERLYTTEIGYSFSDLDAEPPYSMVGIVPGVTGSA